MLIFLLSSAIAWYVSKLLCSQLNLSRNSIGAYRDDGNKWVSTPEGLKAIAEALCVNSSLTSLNLGDNHLSGAIYVDESNLPASNYKNGSKVVYAGRKLTVFDEKDSDDYLLLGSYDGIIALADALRINSSLTSVWTPAHQPQSSCVSALTHSSFIACSPHSLICLTMSCAGSILAKTATTLRRASSQLLTP